VDAVCITCHEVQKQFKTEQVWFKMVVIVQIQVQQIHYIGLESMSRKVLSTIVREIKRRTGLTSVGLGIRVPRKESQ